MYGMSEYLLAMHEVEKARLRDRQELTRRENEEPFPMGSPPESNRRRSERRWWRSLLPRRERRAVAPTMHQVTEENRS